MAGENLDPAASDANQHVFSAEERAQFMEYLGLLISAPGPYSRQWVAEQIASGAVNLPKVVPAGKSSAAE